MSTVTKQMNASREARKRQNIMATRVFSPLSPVIQRVYGGREEGKAFPFPPRPHRSAPRVKFSSKVTEYSDYNHEVDRHGDDSGPRQPSKTHSHHSPSHSSSVHQSIHVPSHAPVSGHGSMGMRSLEYGNVSMRSSEHRNMGMRSEHGMRSSEHGTKGTRTSEHGWGAFSGDRNMLDGDPGYNKHSLGEASHTHTKKPSSEK